MVSADEMRVLNSSSDSMACVYSAEVVNASRHYYEMVQSMDRVMSVVNLCHGMVSVRLIILL